MFFIAWRVRSVVSAFLPLSQLRYEVVVFYFVKPAVQNFSEPIFYMCFALVRTHCSSTTGILLWQPALHRISRSAGSSFFRLPCCVGMFALVMLLFPLFNLLRWFVLFPSSVLCCVCLGHVSVSILSCPALYRVNSLDMPAASERFHCSTRTPQSSSCV